MGVVHKLWRCRWKSPLVVSLLVAMPLRLRVESLLPLRLADFDDDHLE